VERAFGLDTRFAACWVMGCLLSDSPTGAAAVRSRKCDRQEPFPDVAGCFGMTKAHQEKTGLTGRDKSQGELREDVDPRDLPEGLKRERKGPLDKNEGRGGQEGLGTQRGLGGQDGN
jgi:hypothetical protein